MTEIEHKSLPVSGYTSQPNRNVVLVNQSKWLEEFILRMIDNLSENPDTDKRWLAVGKTSIEKGFMAINRCIFKPTRMPEDLYKSISVDVLRHVDPKILEEILNVQTKNNTDKPGSV